MLFLVIRDQCESIQKEKGKEKFVGVEVREGTHVLHSVLHTQVYYDGGLAIKPWINFVIATQRSNAQAKSVSANFLLTSNLPRQVLQMCLPIASGRFGRLCLS
jgi:hypothetical protein